MKPFCGTQDRIRHSCRITREHCGATIAFARWSPSWVDVCVVELFTSGNNYTALGDMRAQRFAKASELFTRLRRIVYRHGRNLRFFQGSCCNVS